MFVVVRSLAFNLFCVSLGKSAQLSDVMLVGLVCNVCYAVFFVCLLSCLGKSVPCVVLVRVYTSGLS